MPDSALIALAAAAASSPDSALIALLTGSGVAGALIPASRIN